ncbi:hypothetical protein NPIL_425051 [Nephila pilipes]|uniref:Uncharacterized protein n=1 Tax=Nephila pilipes TaxID=299642 RepID=A0A8X6MTX4_NEPPI|nr:hypothetical protein NPIL_425051 [Nephila pilipes]
MQQSHFFFVCLKYGCTDAIPNCSEDAAAPLSGTLPWRTRVAGGDEGRALSLDESGETMTITSMPAHPHGEREVALVR